MPEGLDPKLAHVVSAWKHDRPLSACRFDPLGRFVFTSSEDALVERFNLADGARTVFTGGHETWVLSLACSKDGASVVSGGCDGKLSWWNAAGDPAPPIRTIEAHKGWIRSIDVSPDGTLLVSGGNDGRVCLWNMADGKLVRELPSHARNVYCVAFHPSGKHVLSGDLMGVLRQCDVATGAEVRTFDAKPLHTYEGGQQVDYGGVRGIAFSPDGKYVAAGGLYKASNPLGAVNEPLVLLFNWETQKLERQQIAEGIAQGALCRLLWLADGTLVGACGGGTGGFLIFWKPDADKDFFRSGMPALVRDMDLHPDGLQLATSHFDSHVRISRLAAKKA